MTRPVSRVPCRAVREVAILQALRGEQDPRKRQRLHGEMIRVGQWLPQIKALARRWRCDGIDQEDFEAAGMMGLLEAAQRYDGRAGGEGWPTYATQWVRRRMQELARAQGGPIVLETQWEQRTARRQRTQRRPHGWVNVGFGYDGLWNPQDERGRYREVCDAAQELLAVGEEQTAREQQRQALSVIVARLPQWARSSLASITGERAGPLPVLEQTREILRRHALRRLRRELEGV